MSHNANYKIGFLSEWDANDPGAMSGAAYYMRRAFRSLGHETIDIFPTSKAFQARLVLAPGYLAKRAYKARGFYYSPKRSAAYIHAVSRFADRKIGRRKDIDFIFSQSGMPVAGLRTSLPIFMTSDQPFHEYLQGYVPNAAQRFVREGSALEKAVVSRVTKYIYPSEWARDAFCAAHPANRQLAESIPWGANIDVEPDPATVERDIRLKGKAQAYRFLFVGSDWSRKRGAFVLRTVDLLKEAGLDIEVDIVGVKRIDMGGRSKVNVIGYIDKLTPEGSARYDALMRSAHFLFVPSQAEAYGHVFCEAAAYGVPSLTTAVGGIPSIVKHDVNGLCLPFKTTEAQFAQAIRGILSSQDLYAEMARAARSSYEHNLSWKSFASATLELVSKHLRSPTTFD